MSDYIGAPASPPRLIVRVPHAWCGAGPGAIDEVAHAAEELGFWGLSVQDHILQHSSVVSCGSRHAGGDDRTVFEALGTLAFLAGRTRTVRLVTAVLVLAYRHPILLAKEVATIDQLSGGRLVLGVGIGALARQHIDGAQRLTPHAEIARREFEALGVRAHRGRQANEYLEALNALLVQDPASYHGRYVSFDELDLHPRPVQQPRPPIWVGGRSGEALVRATLLADGWFPSQANASGIATGRRQMAAIAAGQGRRAPSDQGVNLFASVGQSNRAAENLMVDALRHRFPDHEALLDATIAGNPERFAQRISQYVAAGVNAFDLKLLPLGVSETIEQLRTIADEVVPLLSQMASRSGGRHG